MPSTNQVKDWRRGRDQWHNDKDNRLYWEFCGVDGEGGNLPDPDALFGEVHRYLLLRAGERTVENPTGLTFSDCANFLCDLPHRRIYVAYFFDYDVTMMIQGLPKDRAERLFDRSKRHNPGFGSPLPVQFGGFDFDYLPHKEFKIRRTGTKAWTVINDVGQFFQTSFLKTLDKWQVGTPDERAMIEKGKSMRADFHGIDDEIRCYNALECLLLEQLMSDFRAVCWETGYVPKKWQGPGYLASAMLDAHAVPRREQIPILANEHFRQLANDAYYGGRFETTAVGPVAGPIYQYDINSAYPSVLRTLPCLIHGSWRRVHNMPDRGQLWFGQVYYDHPTVQFLYNLPNRDKHGNISYQKEGNGVYWSTELEAAAKTGTRVSFSTGWILERHCDCQWFDFIDDYYAYRLRVGKSTKGYVLKLAGNSVYGKIAQSIGYAPYANPVHAGLITAGCRAQIIEAYSQAADRCMMIATDGIFSAAKLNLPLSNKLGEWEETIHGDGIFIVQPGIYYVSSGDVKTRGVERGRINRRREDFESAWEQFVRSQGLNYTVAVPVDNFITGPQALARRKWKLAGTWEHTTRDISYDWASKRDPVTAFREDATNNFRTFPHKGSRTLFSVGYDRLIGGELRVPEAERYRDPGLVEHSRAMEQPDWIEPLIVTESLCSRAYTGRVWRYNGQ